MEQFEIKPVMVDNRYVIKDFSTIAGKISKYAEDECLKELVITNDDDLKAVKAKRTEIRKYLDAIKNARLSINHIVLGGMNDGFKTLEKTLGDADAILKSKKDEWDAAEEAKNPKEPEIVLHAVTCKHMDEKVILKVKAFAEKLGCACLEA
ncbi:MAG: hypothetical protein LKG11_00885 [Bacilli bacterium]|jgi:hypothetical protein|nr:hypothetical protein [Bacilli bacterium]